MAKPVTLTLLAIYISFCVLTSVCLNHAPTTVVILEGLVFAGLSLMGSTQVVKMVLHPSETTLRELSATVSALTQPARSMM